MEGGVEAANRLRDEVSDYLEQFSNAKSWKIMVHLYVDTEGLLARCVSNDIPLSDSSVRDFMLGFTQAHPLFTIVDVGHDLEILSQKVECMFDSNDLSWPIVDTYCEVAMFQLLANNAQCKHLIFGCCHNNVYAVALEKYACNPIMASNITLLKSYETNTTFQGLPFASVEFPRVFRPKPYKESDILAKDVDYIQEPPPKPKSDHITKEAEKSSAKEIAPGNETVVKWPVPAPARPAPKAPFGWATEKNVLLNINDERVDQDLGEVDYETSESMLDLIETQHFCSAYHLRNSCAASSVGKPCSFRHGPRLNDDQLRFLKRGPRRKPCDLGSRCRRYDCIYGHVCPNQPRCERGLNCPLYKFHEVDKTAVRVWAPGKNVSPRKRGSKS